MNRNVLIAGCGYVGEALAKRLLDDGCAVWGLRRNIALLPPGVAPIAADLGVRESIQLPDVPFDGVIYAASANGFTEGAYRAAYVEGVKNVLDALRGHEVGRLIFTSSTGVYGQGDGEIVDESSPAEPPRATGKVLLEGEALVHNASVPSVVVRLSGIYGPGRTRLIDSVRDGSARQVTGRVAILNHIHRDDCAGVLRHVLGLEAPESLYLGVDDEPEDKNVLLRWIAEQLGLPEPAAVDASESDAPTRGGNRKYSNARLRASGYGVEYPTYREGYGALMFP